MTEEFFDTKRERETDLLSSYDGKSIIILIRKERLILMIVFGPKSSQDRTGREYCICNLPVIFIILCG